MLIIQCTVHCNSHVPYVNDSSYPLPTRLPLFPLIPPSHRIPPFPPPPSPPSPCFVQNLSFNACLQNFTQEMIDDNTVIESWLARLRPSPSDLAAGAATIASSELKQHRRMLRYVGERSASKMLGEKVGAPPGTDPSADAAWLYLADPDRRPEFEWRAENAVRHAPPERKADVMHWIAELLTPRGLRRLRALAQELWVHAGSPCSSATGQPITAANVNWPACWAWCVAPTLPTRWQTRSDALTFLCANSLLCSGIATSRPPLLARCTSPAGCCSFSSGV